MKVTVLIENELGAGCSHEMKAEHGLSLLIEQGDTRILMDTGASGEFSRNAALLGADLTHLDAAVLSHNHYDHTGGILRLLEQNPVVPVYVREEAKRRYYRSSRAGGFQYQGEPEQIFVKHPERFLFLQEERQLSSSFWILPNQVQREEYFCRDRGRFFYQEGQEYRPDEFLHEQFLLAREPEGDTVFTSCSHNGIVNILETVRRRFPGDRIQRVVGGFHLKAHTHDSGGNLVETVNCGQEFLEMTAQALARQTEGCIYTCHCTGQVGYSKLKEILGERIQYISTGDVLEW